MKNAMKSSQSPQVTSELLIAQSKNKSLLQENDDIKTQLKHTTLSRSNTERQLMTREAEMQSLQRQLSQATTALEEARAREAEQQQQHSMELRQTRANHDTELHKLRIELDTTQRQLEEMRVQHSQAQGWREDALQRISSLERSVQSAEKAKRKLEQQLQQATESRDLQVRQGHCEVVLIPRQVQTVDSVTNEKNALARQLETARRNITEQAEMLLELQKSQGVCFNSIVSL